MPPQAVLVLVFDDLHWAGDGSLDAIVHLAGAGHDLPLLTICATRPKLLERRIGLAQARPMNGCLLLQPLAPDDREALAASLLQHLRPHVDGPALRQLLIERTDGNPCCMEALLQMLVDQGVLVTSTMHWQLAAGSLSNLQVPPTLVGVLQARLDALLAPQRRALQQASVVGAVFWDDALAALDDHAPTELRALCQRALALPREHSAFADAREFAFRHHLLHEVTYGTVLKRDKRDQHHRAALWLQARSSGRWRRRQRWTGMPTARRWRMPIVRWRWTPAVTRSNVLRCCGYAPTCGRAAVMWVNMLQPSPRSRGRPRPRTMTCCGSSQPTAASTACAWMASMKRRIDWACDTSLQQSHGPRPRPPSSTTC